VSASAADSLARRADLALTPEVRPQVERILRGRSRSVFVGIVLAAVIVVPLQLFVSTGLGGLELILFATFGAGFGLAMGTVVSSRPARNRMTHLRRPGLFDYVAPWQVAMWFVLPAIGAITSITLLLGLEGHDINSADRRAAWVTLTAVVLLPFLTLALAGVVVRRRRWATTTQALAFDDALRAQALSDLFALPLSGLFAGALLNTEFSPGTSSQPFFWLGLVAIGVGAALYAGLAWHERRATGARMRFKTRLYPAAPATPDQVRSPVRLTGTAS
jgi:hypothetical protein